MGLFDKLQEKMQSFMQAQNEARTEEWFSEIKSEEEVRQYEAQGIDMSPYYEWRAAKIRKSEMEPAVRYGIGEFDPADVENPIRLDKLTPYKSTPRDVNSDFVKDCAGKLPLFGKDTYLKEIAEAPVVYTAVVQAYNPLWAPGPSDEAMGAVFVFARDPAHRYDVAWLKSTSKAISDMKVSANVPDDCQKFIDTLRKDSGYFCFPLGKSLNGGADAWCATFSIHEEEKKILPKTYLPSEGIVPMLLKAPPEEDHFVDFQMIPAKYYTP
jgi:hypothetical protein